MTLSQGIFSNAMLAKLLGDEAQSLENDHMRLPVAILSPRGGGSKAGGRLVALVGAPTDLKALDPRLLAFVKGCQPQFY